MQEPEEQIEARAREILEEIVDAILLEAGEPNEVLARLVARLAEELPFSYLTKTESIDYISGKIRDTIFTVLDKQLLMQTVQSITSVQRDEMNIIIDQILERVFGEGIDYLYFIHNQ